MPMGWLLLTKKSKRRDKISLKIIVKNVIMTRMSVTAAGEKTFKSRHPLRTYSV